MNIKLAIPSGEKLRTAARLHSTGLAAWHLVLMLVAGLLAVAVAVSTTPVGQDWAESGRDTLDSSWHDTKSFFSGLL